MLNKIQHQRIMGQILKDIYTDILLAPLLGFKGGTCAYFFYELTRFSVDLDFDLLVDLNQNDLENILKKILNIIQNYGNIKESYIKKYTVFALLSYGDKDHNIKIEISRRELPFTIKPYYQLKEYLNISMLVAKPDYLFANKLVALTSRKKMAMRDVYDIYFFAKHNWDIDEEIIKTRTGKTVKGYLQDCVSFVEKIKDNQILQGIGELLSEKEKIWAKKNLKSEVIFLLKNYLSVIR